MRKVIFAAALVTGVVGLSSSSFATMSGHMPAAFGPVYEMEPTVPGMKGHMMHMSVIQDDTGAQWVVMPKEEAEAFFGPISASAMHWAGK
jgi:hypothetical protein